MILVDNLKEVEVKHSPLLEDLLVKWGYTPEERLNVKDVDKLTLELSAWGVPWKRLNWN